MLLSVVIPTYKRANTIGAAVQSILNGSYTSFEILVVDQSSDDSTERALAPLLADRRVRYLKQATPGASAARNRGIVASRGEVIVFTDDDVEAAPDWLELIAAEFAADPALGLVSGALVAPPYDRSTGYIPEFIPHAGLSSMRLVLLVANANLSMRRSLFERVGGYDELCGPGGVLKNSDDGDIVLRFIRGGAKWKGCPQIVVVHTHGFRPGQAGNALLDEYQYANGAIFGRAVRRGDLYVALWFLAREAKQLARSAGRALRGLPGGDRHLVRLRGFVHGFRLPPQQGFINGAEIRRRTEAQHAL